MGFSTYFSDRFYNETSLKRERTKGSWLEVAQGSPGKLNRIIIEDPKGVFHGLGTLDGSIRHAREKRLDRLQLVKNGKFRFVHADSGAECTVQEILFQYFGMPIQVIAEPREWYAYKRQPRMVEISKDWTVVLVRFSSLNISFGTEFSGTCLYVIVNSKWRAFAVRPNHRESIAQAIAWLEKMEWQGW